MWRPELVRRFNLSGSRGAKVTSRRPPARPRHPRPCGSDRLQLLKLGAARVRIPKEHHIGQIELPREGFTLFGITLRAHRDGFVIEKVMALDRDEWITAAATAGSDEALVFVHGYANTFDDALMRTAQIKWDLQYKGLVVLFSWPSKGEVLGYEYDRDSALGARTRFLDLIKLLQVEAGIKKINVLAHSMGNLVAVDALASYARTQNPRATSELIMAAPDVDQDMFINDISDVSKIVKGMTLYASSADRP
jgi:esterase/lipase superfamily enzyme